MATQRRRAGQARAQKDIEKSLFGGYKLPSTNDKMADAKRQTRADVQDFKKNRAAGDKVMKSYAADSAPEYKHGYNDRRTQRGDVFQHTEKFGTKGGMIEGRGNEKASKVPNVKAKKMPQTSPKIKEQVAKETYENAKAWAKEEEKKNGKKRT